VLATNRYKNPFWNTTGLFKTSGGHCSRIAVCWHVASGETDRASIYGSLRSFIMKRPEGSPDTVMSISKDGKIIADANGYPEGEVKIEAFQAPNHFELLPPSLRVPGGHGDSTVFLTHEFISSLVEDRWPTVTAGWRRAQLCGRRTRLKSGEPIPTQNRRIIEVVEPEARPRPLLGRSHQAALHRAGWRRFAFCASLQLSRRKSACSSPPCEPRRCPREETASRDRRHHRHDVCAGRRLFIAITRPKGVASHSTSRELC
jgi:hypothetical protein